MCCRKLLLRVWTMLMLMDRPRRKISLVWTDLMTVGAFVLLWRLTLDRHKRLRGPMQVIALLFITLGMSPPMILGCIMSRLGALGLLTNPRGDKKIVLVQVSLLGGPTLTLMQGLVVVQL